MADEHRNGGSDDESPPRMGRRPPLRIVAPHGAPTPERDRSIADAIFAMSHRLNEIDSDVIDVKLAVINIERKLYGGAPPQKIDADSSYNVLDATMREAVDTLYARAKDPRDKMDSERARAIAKEVVAASKDADDAQALRAWRGRRWSVLLKVLEVLIAAAVGAAAAHYGLQ